MVETSRRRAPDKLCSYWPLGTKTCQMMFLVAAQHKNMSETEKRAFKFEMMEKGATSNMDGTVNIPTCLDCVRDHFCRAVRIKNDQFHLSKSQQKKVDVFLQNFECIIERPVYRQDLFLLFKQYLFARHSNTNTQMVKYTGEDFQSLLQHPAWIMVARSKQSRVPVSFALIDQHKDDFCLEYLAYDIHKMKYSPGLSSILTAADFLKTAYPAGHLYLGSWSPGSPKLGYKNQFNGLEIRGKNGWLPLSRHAGPSMAPQPPSIDSY